MKTDSALVLRLEENKISLEDIKSMFRTRKRLFRFTILIPVDFENVLSERISKETDSKVVNLWQK